MKGTKYAVSLVLIIALTVAGAVAASGWSPTIGQTQTTTSISTVTFYMGNNATTQTTSTSYVTVTNTQFVTLTNTSTLYVVGVLNGTALVNAPTITVAPSSSFGNIGCGTFTPDTSALPYKASCSFTAESGTNGTITLGVYTNSQVGVPITIKFSSNSSMVFSNPTQSGTVTTATTSFVTSVTIPITAASGAYPFIITVSMGSR